MYRFDYKDWCTPHIPFWKNFIRKVVKAPGNDPINIIEVGCFEGRSTLFFSKILGRNAMSQMYCIDTWLGGEEISRLKLPFNMKQVKQNFLTNLEQNINKQQIKVFEESSETALVSLLNQLYNKVDLIYLDGSHTQRDTCVDLMLSFLLLRKGGGVIIDDYLNMMATQNNLLRPQKAVDNIVEMLGTEVEMSVSPENQAFILKV